MINGIYEREGGRGNESSAAFLYAWEQVKKVKGIYDQKKSLNSGFFFNTRSNCGKLL